MKNELENLKLKIVKWMIFTLVSLVTGHVFNIDLFILFGILSANWCLILVVFFIYFAMKNL